MRARGGPPATVAAVAGPPAIDGHVRVAHLSDDLARRMTRLATDGADLDRSRSVVERALSTGGTYYGINTGFGVLASTRIARADVERLQRNLLVSHAVGVGDPVPKPIARVMLGLKIHALALGYSGVSRRTFDRLLDFARLDLVPVVPLQGSVGASGDLAPLAHLCLPLIGQGAFWSADGRETRSAADVLAAHGLAPIELQAKDGLALINGTQFMSAHGAWALERALRLVRLADLAGALSLEALEGRSAPFDPRVHGVRPHPGQAASAAEVMRFVAGSQLVDRPGTGRVQDPYSLRCLPQVHGASRDALEYARAVVETEINSVTDNPLVFAEGDIISGGNFHGQPLALALDFAAMALAELASISERRTYLLLDGRHGLPQMLVNHQGLNSGLMMVQYTAAALVSENKGLCHPASVDSIPTSQGQEDHVSMGSISAVKLQRVLSHVETVLAIECLTAAQAIDFRAPARPGRGTSAAHAALRAVVPHVDHDTTFDGLIASVHELVQHGTLLSAADEATIR